MSASQRDSDSDAVVLMRAAQIIRREMFQKKHSFNGSFRDDNLDSIPATLLALIQMILGGTSIKTQTENNEDVSSAVLLLAQLMIFNSVKRARKGSHSMRHSPDRETLLPLYIGILVHSKTSKRDLVDILYSKGLSVSYNRVLQISSDVANRVIELFEEDGVVCPPKLLSGLYTTGKLDNIDHNPSSASAQSAFHGTAISLTQHPSEENSGTERHDIIIAPCEDGKHSKSIKQLPDSYTHVPPATFPNDYPQPPKTEDCVIPRNTLLSSDETQEHWLIKAHQLLEEEQLEPDDYISWSASFAQMQEAIPRPPAITGLLPLFCESAHSLAMVKHGMDIIKNATHHVNPGQIPVMTVDQPLYAIAKKIQWTWPEVYGEKHYFILMGGLHIAMTFLRVLGEWLEGSGWKFMLSTADVTTEGRADSLLRGSDTARAQWAHQVTGAASFVLQTEAYSAYRETTDAEDILPFSQWCGEMANKHPQFFYWNKTLQLEILLLQFL